MRLVRPGPLALKLQIELSDLSEVGKVIRHLTKRVIDGESRARNDVLIIHISGDPNNSAQSFAHADEVHHGIGPHHVPIERVLVGEHPLREALADDDYRLAAAAVIIVGSPDLPQWARRVPRKIPAKPRGTAPVDPLHDCLLHGLRR
jgi:hypothetical protein